MTAWKVWTAVALTLLCCGSAAAQGLIPRSIDAAAFIGTWALTMSEPREFEGTQQTVRIWAKDGVTSASFQVGRFPATEVTGIFKDGNMLVLTIGHHARPQLFENGAPLWAVITLTLDGDTMRMAQMLERSQIIKRGTGKRLPN